MSGEEKKQIEDLLRSLKKTSILEEPPFRKEVYRKALLDSEKEEKRKKIYFVAALVLFFLTIGISYFYVETGKETLSSQNQKKHYIGFVRTKKGSVNSVVVGGEVKKVTGGELLEDQSLFFTGEGSGLEIHLKGDYRIILFENTKFSIETKGKNFVIFQEFGKSVHFAGWKDRSLYTIETPGIKVFVTGTFFSLENRENSTRIEVLEGSVQVQIKKNKQIHNVSNQEMLQIDEKDNTIQKKISKNPGLVVLYNEMSGKWIPLEEGLWEDLQRIPGTNERRTLEEYYNQRIEKLVLKDGRILEGIIVSQNETFAILHTTEGVLVMPLTEIKEILYE